MCKEKKIFVSERTILRLQRRRKQKLKKNLPATSFFSLYLFVGPSVGFRVGPSVGWGVGLFVGGLDGDELGL